MVRYGIPDPMTKQPLLREPNGNADFVRIVWTGSIEPRKGPDVLVEAIRRLRPDSRGRVEVSLVGAILFPEYGQQLTLASRGLPVRLVGELAREYPHRRCEHRDLRLHVA